MGVERQTGGVCKGSGDPWIATRIAADIEEFGHGGSRVVLKADQEVAIVEVQGQVGPVGESQSNGRVENAVQRVQGLIRTLKDALDKILNTRIKSSDPVFACVVEWSAGPITRYVKGLTGRTAYTEARGHDAQATVEEMERRSRT